MINDPKVGQKVLYINAPVPYGPITDKPPASPIYYLSLGTIESKYKEMPKRAKFKPEVYLYEPTLSFTISGGAISVPKRDLFAIGDSDVFKLIFQNGLG